MKTLFRAFTLLLLAAILLLSLTSCGEDYKMRESSEKEATPVFTLGEDTVNFEVLYTFFRNRLEVAGLREDQLDDGRYEAILNEAKAEIAEIYALFAVCRSVGIDPESEEVEERITEYLKMNVEGGVVGDTWIEGYESYDDYLADIKDKYHMNDAVNRLMLRYAVCEDLLASYYQASYPYTEGDVRAFFEGEDCLHIVWVGRTESDGGLGREENLDLMERIKGKLESGDIRGAVGLSMRQDTDFYMGRYSKDEAYYGELIEIAYGLDVGETSRVLDLGTAGFFVVKRLEKSSSDLADRYEEIEEVFLADAMYERVDTKGAELLEGIVYMDAYNSLTIGDFFD